MKNILTMVCFVALLLCGSLSFAAFEDVAVGVRGRALGNSGPALDDSAGIFLNPALSGAARKFEAGAHFESGTRSTLGPQDFDSYSFIASLPRVDSSKLGTVALAFRQRAIGTDLSETTAVLGYGTWQFSRVETGSVDFGMNFKILRLASDLNSESAAAPGIDLGCLWRFSPKNSAGFSILNLNSPSFKLGNYKDKAPFIARFGVAEKTEDYALSLDFASRSGSGGYKGNFSLDSGFEHIWRTMRSGTIITRAGLSMAQKASYLSFGLGYKRLSAEAAYALIMPVTGALVPGHALSLILRFGDKDIESEYERLMRQEIKYRRDLVEALDESSRREGVLRDELSSMKDEINDLSVALKSTKEQKAASAQAKERLEAVLARQKKADEELKQLEELRKKDKFTRLKTDFNVDWQSYMKLKSGGAPADVLKGSLQRIISQYQATGLDISIATVELQKLIP